MISEKIIEQASKILKDHNIHSHELDAQLILSDIMKVKKIGRASCRERV